MPNLDAADRDVNRDGKDEQNAVNRNKDCYIEEFFFPILDMANYDSGSSKNYIQMHGSKYEHIDPLFSKEEGIKGPGGVSVVDKLKTALKKIYIKKTYVKASVDEELIYDDPENIFAGFGFPRAIVNIPEPIYINTSSYLGNKDSASIYNKISAVSTAEDFAILAYLNNQKINTELHNALIQLFQHFFGMYLVSGNLSFMTAGTARPVGPVDAPAQVGVTVDVTSDNATLTPDYSTFGSFADLRKAYFNKQMSPKAAVAGFAAIPVESEQFVYGPWVNYPDLQRHKIFPYLNDTQRLSAIENMIGDTKVEYKPEFVPENYNGMYMLDQVASELLESETSYQQKFENGSLTIPGLPLFSLGDELSQYGSSIGYFVPVDDDNNCIGKGIIRRKASINTGPNVTNISVQFGRQPETRYTFKTYQSKLNVFNKRNADNMTQISDIQQKMRKDFFNRLASISEQNSRNMKLYSTFRDKFYAKQAGEYTVTSTSSPVEVLMGNVYDYAARITGSNTGVYYSKRSNIGLFDTKEIPRELTSSYSLKSFMSLDGFYSPVSFFPTKWNHTVSYTKFEKTKCPVCNGTKKYKEIRVPKMASATQTAQVHQEVDVYCDYCEDTPFHKQANIQKSIKQPKIPPFILASGLNIAVRQSTTGSNTDTVVYEYVSDKNLIQNPKNYLKTLTGNSDIINLISLNPIISVSGSFRNKNASASDFSGHSIEIVGRGYVASSNSLRIPEDIVSGSVVGTPLIGSSRIPRSSDTTIQQLDNIIPKAFADIDYDSYDMRVLMKNSPINKILELNQRFFSFKGPMVLHGWGYDTDGYPVPNASGDPINSGIYVPHPTTGAFWKTRSLNVQGSNDINNPDYGDILIGKNMVWDTQSSSWSEPYREKEFLKGWGLKQNAWPVGPIDLRWDSGRRVWVAGGTGDDYDDMYITLEEDLILEQNSRSSYPARGFLDDLDFNKEPLPSGTRRVVFVRDRSGYTAPRGAKLLCRYNTNSGFYEPITKPNIMCSGIIRQGTNAEIFANYSEPSSGAIQNVMKISVTFLNNLNFELKPDHKAMFVYMDGAWNLLSVGKP